ncbi:MULTISPECIES: Cof-type HAD-IIB family hydrolase [Terrabacteria group]|uniref:Cof-type HAD-IIB family hydrolase n=1 Tax=Bacillati TaxID=1783272 RepID=UPI001939AAD7|nr:MULTISPECIES: Cof-type HAD-IIB family hydrolase [Terrabacteria group]MBW9212214.1 Cof-type HAD-IIB family hydrolase [Trueperella sp. zg.1013]QRG86241.1 Cof-type HAD-IIB family hydrolase [Bulleidia sp. zg-1006]
MKTIFFDIDGTLLSFQTHRISKQTLQSLYQLKEKGFQLAIASGRSPIQLPSLDSSLIRFPWDAYVLLNGQYVLNAKKECVYDLAIPEESVRKSFAYMAKKEAVCAYFAKDQSFYVCQNKKVMDCFKQNPYLPNFYETNSMEEILAKKIYQICPYFSEEEDKAFLEAVPAVKSQRWIDVFADMVPEEGGKSKGIEKAIELFGFSKEWVCFGDGGNDKSMLQKATLSIAMGNAKEDIKAIADYVTASVDDEGITQALKHFGFLSK